MSNDKRTSVFGIYTTLAAADHAADELIRRVFTRSDISVLVPESGGVRDLGTEKHTKAPEGTTTGATTGGVIGGTLGLLVGIGALAIPGLGPFIAAGPIMATLAGVGAGGAVGGLIGALAGLGMPEYEAKRYEGRMKTGGILLSAHCDTAKQIEVAKDVLKATGAEDIASAGEEKADDDAVRIDRTVDPRHTRM